MTPQQPDDTSLAEEYTRMYDALREAEAHSVAHALLTFGRHNWERLLTPARSVSSPLAPFSGRSVPR